MPEYYQDGEFCKAVNCPIYPQFMAGNIAQCVRGCWAFKAINYLLENGYRILRLAEHEHFLTINPGVFDNRESEDDDDGGYGEWCKNESI